jgi:glycosyltransferase involved in cell wall biosynthesis
MKRYYEKWKQEYKDVHFLGFIPDEILPYYYSMADLFITYSYAAEGFGLTPIEAIACGTPVICSAIPVFKEILEDNAIFVPPKNPRLLANEIEKLLKDEELRKNLIQKAQIFIKKYSWNSVGQKLVKIYEKLSN